MLKIWESTVSIDDKNSQIVNMEIELESARLPKREVDERIPTGG